MEFIERRARVRSSGNQAGSEFVVGRVGDICENIHTIKVLLPNVSFKGIADAPNAISHLDRVNNCSSLSNELDRSRIKKSQANCPQRSHDSFQQRKLLTGEILPIGNRISDTSVEVSGRNGDTRPVLLDKRKPCEVSSMDRREFRERFRIEVCVCMKAGSEHTIVGKS